MKTPPYRKLLAGLGVADRQFALARAQCCAVAPTMFREVRRGLDLTQQQLAEKLGVTNVYLSKIERGHQQPGVPVMLGLAALLREEG